jgi:hypothetical protein
MESSVDAAPIVIRGAFWKTVLLVAGAVGFVLLGIWILRAPGGLLIATVAILFFGLCAVSGVIRLFKPVFVEISPKGIRWYDGWRTHVFTWSDFAGFRLAQVGRTTFVGFDLSSGSTQKLAMRIANRAIAGIDGTFPTQLEIGPAELLSLILSAQRKLA